MNASPAITPGSGPISNRRTAEHMHVPLAWRIGQGTFLLIILAMAAAYDKWGWMNISGQMKPERGPLLTDQIGFLVLAGLVYCTTPIAGTIAMSTLQEALRRRWVLGFLGFSMVVIACFSTFTSAQPGQEQGFLKDIGTTFIVGMTLLIAIFLGVALVPPEIERRTIFTILSKPVNRVEFLVGKYMGLCLTLLFCSVLLGGFFLCVFAGFVIRQEGWSAAWTQIGSGATSTHVALGFTLQNITKALVLNYGQLVVLAALSLMLSLIVTPITAITFCFLAYFGGTMSSYWGHLGGGDDHDHGDAKEDAKGLDKSMKVVVKAVYYMLPRMDHFDVRNQLVTDSNVGYAFMWKAWSAGLLYIAVLLVIAYLIFSDREF